MKWLAIISGAMALIAILPGLPYFYYILLRWVLFISSGVFAYNYFNINKQGWGFTYSAIAFLFNPIFPIYLERSTWVIFDFIVAIIMFAAIKPLEMMSRSK
jgi:hypothetical protein